MGLMGGGGTAPGPGGSGTTTARARRPGLSAARTREALTGYALLAPGLIGVLLFVIVPAGALVWLSARKWGLLSDPEFVGPSQVGRVLSDPEFLGSLRVTLLLALLVVPAQVAGAQQTEPVVVPQHPGARLLRRTGKTPGKCFSGADPCASRRGQLLPLSARFPLYRT